MWTIIGGRKLLWKTLSKLAPAFRKDGIVTAGNASGIVDGAAAVVVTHAKTAKARGWKPLGRIVSLGTVGVDPRIMGIGPVPASQKALAAAGLKIAQMDRVEVNEAFAPQYLAVEKGLGLDRDEDQCEWRRDCVGTSAGRFRNAVDFDAAAGIAAQRICVMDLATACIGGGQGIAMIVEAMQ